MSSSAGVKKTIKSHLDRIRMICYFFRLREEYPEVKDRTPTEDGILKLNRNVSFAAG